MTHSTNGGLDLFPHIDMSDKPTASEDKYYVAANLYQQTINLYEFTNELTNRFPAMQDSEAHAIWYTIDAYEDTYR